MARAGIMAVDATGRATPVLAASWRAGGVRSAMDAGLSDSMIMELGRWCSVAWRHYLLRTPLDFGTASRRMWRAAAGSRISRQRVGGGEVAQLCSASDAQAVLRAQQLWDLRLRITRAGVSAANAAAMAAAGDGV
jgi:hypothetical protein